MASVNHCDRCKDTGVVQVPHCNEPHCRDTGLVLGGNPATMVCACACAECDPLCKCGATQPSKPMRWLVIWRTPTDVTIVPFEHERDARAMYDRALAAGHDGDLFLTQVRAGPGNLCGELP